MVDQIKTGTILIEEGIILPASLQFESEAYSTSWRTVKNLDGYELDRKIRATGWNFFFLAGEVNAIAFGSDVQKTIHKAITRLAVRMQLQPLNCLQLTRVAFKHFLGFPYVSVSGHWRHIQKSMFLPRAIGLAEGTA
jgi:hypothetical protein